MSLKGIDVSHWQGGISWDKTGVDFAIIKCTQGDSMIDPMFSRNKTGARRAGILCGYYHFAQHNDPIQEADWFVKNVGDIQTGELLALDAETGQDPSWCKKFLDRVASKVGFKPLIYCPAGNGMDWSPVISGNYGLWIARYGLNLGYMLTSWPPKIGKWPFYAIWQYTSKGRVPGIVGNVDLDYFKYDKQTLMKYGK